MDADSIRASLKRYGKVGSEYLRRMGLGDLRAPSEAEDDDQFEDVSGFRLPTNFARINQDAKDFESLVKHPAWKKMLDILERQADIALGSLRLCESNDPMVIKGLRDRWVESESRIRIIEKIVIDSIAMRDTMIADIAMKYGTDSTDDLLSEVKVVTQMKAQLRKEGMIAVDPNEVNGMSFDDENGGQ